MGVNTTVIIACYNGEQFLHKLIYLLSHEPCKVIAVDDNSYDKTWQILNQYEFVRKLRNNQDKGFAEVNNLGASLAGTKYVLFLNQDMEPVPGFIKAMEERMEATPECAIVGAKLVFPVSSIRHVVIGERPHVLTRVAGRLDHAGIDLNSKFLPYEVGRNNHPTEAEWSALEREHEAWLREQGKNPASMSIQERIEQSKKWLAEVKGFPADKVEEIASHWWGPAIFGKKIESQGQLSLDDLVGIMEGTRAIRARVLRFDSGRAKVTLRLFFGSFGVIRDVDLDLAPAATAWLLAEGVPDSYGSKEAQFLTERKTNVDDQVTGMIVLALGSVKIVRGAWETYLDMKKPGALPDVLEAQVNMVRRDINDTMGTLQSILSRLLLY